MPVQYVAIGDSFTEGIGDERADGSVRGWADRVAEGLAAAGGEPVLYANLAIRGRRLGPIIDEQLEPALALEPTLMTFNGGGNDIMRRHVDMPALMDLSRHVVDRCRETGVTLVALAGPDPTSRIPMGHVVHRRGEALTVDILRLTDQFGLTFVDMWHDAEITKKSSQAVTVEHSVADELLHRAAVALQKLRASPRSSGSSASAAPRDRASHPGWSTR